MHPRRLHFHHSLIGLALLALATLPGLAAGEDKAEANIDWQAWSPALFERAAAEERFVFLYLEAVWCHWCHVMQRETFRDASVKDALDTHYLAARVDHDAHPALANRYRAWGWPALIFLAPDGTEIVKRAGYIAPGPFRRLLAAIVEDPSPEAGSVATTHDAVGAQSALDGTLRARLQARHRDAHDAELGGLDSMQKYMDRDSVEYAMARASDGDARQAEQARRTLDAATALIDPVWGGAYQYSTRGNWENPHFEKIMRTQAGMLRVYAMADAQFGDPAYRNAARAIRDYLLRFLRDESGAFYVSQDADLIPGEKSAAYFALGDEERRQRGMPAIDKSCYALQNGQAIHALASAYAYVGDGAALSAARKAADWVIAHRALEGGGFAHGAEDTGGPFLGDSLHMGRGLLALYQATGERRWLEHAISTADFLIDRFRREGGGFRSAVSDGTPVAPLPDIEENIATARWLNLLGHYSGQAAHLEAARHAMAYLATEEIALTRMTDAGILLADDELGAPPQHLTVVGPRSDATTQALLRVALATPGAYRRIELWDPAEGKLPNHDVNYPKFERPAGYVCRDERCSRPSFEPDVYARQIERLAASE